MTGKTVNWACNKCDSPRQTSSDWSSPAVGMEFDRFCLTCNRVTLHTVVSCE